MEAVWNDDEGIWKVKIKNLLNGHEFTDTAEILINNEGLLKSVSLLILILSCPLTCASNWRWPRIEGLHEFKGHLVHTAVYDTSADLSGKRVAVIGMGSTALQLIPTIAPEVSHLYTFVRSPTWVTPGFAQKYSGPGGTNFDCNVPRPNIPQLVLSICPQIPRSKKTTSGRILQSIRNMQRVLRMSSISGSGIFCKALLKRWKQRRFAARIMSI